MGALKMKGEKTAGLDGIAVEMLKNGGFNILELLSRIFHICMEKTGVVQDDYKVAYIVLVY